MKYILKTLLVGLAVSALLASCEKDENRVQFEGGTAPVLSTNRSGSIPLSFATTNDQAIRISWTNPNFNFNTGTSSQNVSYQLEIDTVGGNFNSSNKRVITVANDLSRTYTQGEFNDILLNSMELRAGRQYNIEMRVRAGIAGAPGTTVSSNTLRYAVTPFAIPPKVQPYTGDVYVVGNATPGDWNNPVPVPSQKMTQVSPTLYEITLQLNGGNAMLFLPENGSWARKYGFNGDKEKNNQNGDEFVREGADIKVPNESGRYKITLNFQTGRFSFTRI